MPFITKGKGASPYPYTDYKKYIPAAFKRYMQNIYGEGGTKDYVRSQVKGVSSAFQPYFNQMSTQGAAGIAGRGGAGGGSADALLAKLFGQKTHALTQAGSGAYRDVTQTGANMMGLAQGEGFRLSEDQIRKIMLELEKRRVSLAENRDWMSKIADILGAGGMFAGATA